MKVDQTKSFTPVVITLETQDEVDALASVLRHSRLIDALNPAFDIYSWHKFSRILSDEGCNRYHDNLLKIIK